MDFPINYTVVHKQDIFLSRRVVFHSCSVKRGWGWGEKLIPSQYVELPIGPASMDIESNLVLTLWK